MEKSYFQFMLELKEATDDERIEEYLIMRDEAEETASYYSYENTLTDCSNCKWYHEPWGCPEDTDENGNCRNYNDGDEEAE